MGFQSTLPRRERLDWLTGWYKSYKFQSTLPRRERRSAAARSIQSKDHFNPRSREGSDYAVKREGKGRAISIHAPAKGATAEENIVKRKHAISIHAPAKGATSFAANPGGGIKISIHAPAKGATVIVVQLSSDGKISIHAPAKGATPKRRFTVTIKLFQSTLPRRERQYL